MKKILILSANPKNVSRLRRGDGNDYSRLSFVLLGVCTPSNLIKDSLRTPFNIGKAIDLTGFQLEETKPLAQGLASVGDSQELIKAVLDWTGGQPFLTQKVCKLILAAEKNAIAKGEERFWVENLVKRWIIENWATQDEPEHLRTIRNRIMGSGEQRTGMLLGLCQQILQQGEINADDSAEQTELRLTGLVVKRDGKLRIYNRIYLEVFNQKWCVRILDSLRPYSDYFNAWVASNYQDESYLLRGETLQEALNWSVGKSLSQQDYNFLAACQKFDKTEAIEETKRQADVIVRKATSKAKQQIRFGFIIMSLSILFGISYFVIKPWVARLFNDIGHAKSNNGEYEDAIQYYNLAMMTDPNNPMPAFNRGFAYRKLKKYREARLSYIIGIEQDFAPAFNNLAYLYITQDKNYSDAIELLEIGLDKPMKGYPEPIAKASMYKNLGWAQFELKQYDQAETNLKTAIKLRNYVGASHCLLAKVLVAKNQPARSQWQNCKNKANPDKPEQKIWIEEAEEYLKINS